MDKSSASILNVLDGESLIKALNQTVHQLQTQESDNWSGLFQLIGKLIENQINFDARSIFALCKDYLEKQQSEKNVRLVSEVLNRICDHVNFDEYRNEFTQLLNDLQLSVIHHLKHTQKTQGPLYEYRTATVTLSSVLPSAVRVGLIADSNTLIEIITLMVRTKSEVCVVEALSNMFPHIASTKAVSWDAIYEAVKHLFQNDAEDYKTANHPGYTALCAMADLIFSQDTRHILEEQWFLNGIRCGLSNPVALNRKRSQYLLKRYVDARISSNPGVFFDIFLLLETLEEKQTHIIKPVLARLDALTDQVLVRKQADPTWLMAVYSRIISHENLQIVKWGVQRICKLNLSIHSDSIGEDDLFHELVSFSQLQIITMIIEINLKILVSPELESHNILYSRCG